MHALANQDTRKTGRRRGFTKVHNETLWDAELSLPARTVHAMLLDLAFRATHEDRDAYTTELEHTEAQIAAMAGCSLGALRRYVDELRDARLVATVRASRRAKVLWEILRTPSPSESERLSRSDSAQPRARPSSLEDVKNEDQSFADAAGAAPRSVELDDIFSLYSGPSPLELVAEEWTS